LYCDPKNNEPFADNAERFIFFSKAVVELAKRMDPTPAVVHAHDWQTALVPVLIREQALPIRTVLTLHNVAFQGNFSGVDFQLTNLPQHWMSPSGLEFFGAMNLLKGGILAADALTTVSKRYREEILNLPRGCGLEGTLRSRAGDLISVPIGVDPARWSPSRPDAAANLAAATQAQESIRSFRGYLTFRRTAGLVDAEAALTSAAAIRRRSLDAIAAAEAAAPRSRDELVRRTAAAADFRRKLAELGAEVAKNEQGGGPLTTERDELTKTRSAQLKEYARLQARPALVEKELEAKSTPLREPLKVAQEALKPLEASLAEVRARLAVALKPVEAKRAEVAAAATKLAAARQAAAVAEKAHAALVRELPERARTLDELARSLAELQPQVEPLKAKVKASEAQYLAMLPKP
jgi:predicted  nucleic acid-binding Zn-ribbon protein